MGIWCEYPCEAKPDLLGSAVLAALSAVGAAYGIGHEVVQCETFAPSPPVPPPASRLTVRL